MGDLADQDSPCLPAVGVRAEVRAKKTCGRRVIVRPACRSVRVVVTLAPRGEALDVNLEEPAHKVAPRDRDHREDRGDGETLIQSHAVTEQR